MIHRHLASRVAALLGQALAAAAAIVQVGSGSYTTTLPPGAEGPPAAIRRTAEAEGKMPTNDWWSSLAWGTNAFDHFPHPLAVRVLPGGLRLAYPGSLITANRAGIFGSMPGGGDDLILSHAAMPAFPAPLVDGWSDWFVALRFATNGHSLRVAYGHGSPFVFATTTGGQPQVRFTAPPQIFSGGETSATLGVTVHGRHYGVFGPTGARWQGLGTATLTCDTEKAFCSVAVLPDNTPATLALFQRHAHAHITDTRADWRYDPTTSSVTTTFRITTVAREGTERGTLFALYPHQWRNTSTPLLPLSYGSVRGTLKLAAGESFITRMTFPGVLPVLPDAGGLTREQMAALLRPELAAGPARLTDTYWNGKQLGRTATLAALAAEYGLADDAAKLRQRLQADLENWLSAVGPDGQPKSRGLFYYDPNWGALIGYPASYGSDRELNDHHFHYGYFVRAAAELAQHDPAWAADARWGGMVKLHIRDFASGDRHDPLFPYLRNFDPYAGHSWASGHGRFGDGNNNESSSEAMNAWCALILWGEAAGDRALRDLGVCLFTTELHAIQEYWFDVHGDNFPQSYPASVVTMVWSGKGANATWFSADPQMVHGINFLPFHGGSLYLGLHPDYVEKNFRALVAEHGSQTFTNWADLLWMYRALSDAPEAARLAAAGDATKTEAGNSPANLAHWLANLQKLGRVERGITADTPLFAVFRQGSTRHYIAWNLSREPRQVTFSDGSKLEVPAHQHARGTRPVND